MSGGEKARVALATFVLVPHNLLVLDEPSNHLDRATVAVLTEALQEYKDLLEEQVRSLNGFVILHEKEKEHLHREVDELRLARDSDRELIDSLRLELSNLGGLSLRCHEQAQDSEKISYSCEPSLFR